MTTHKEPFKLDPDIYDTLVGMAWYFGGVSSRVRCYEDAPLCGIGFLEFAGVPCASGNYDLNDQRMRFGFDIFIWDDAVDRVRVTYPKRVTTTMTSDYMYIRRVPLKLVLKELNIIRGD